MNLQEYAKSRWGNQARLARYLGVKPMTVARYINGEIKPPIERCILIEEITDRQVTCEELRPELPWKRLDKRLDAEAIKALRECARLDN